MCYLASVCSTNLNFKKVWRALENVLAGTFLPPGSGLATPVLCQCSCINFVPIYISPSKYQPILSSIEMVRPIRLTFYHSSIRQVNVWQLNFHSNQVFSSRIPTAKLSEALSSCLYLTGQLKMKPFVPICRFHYLWMGNRKQSTLK